jgi:hypothetical protein
MSREMDHKVIVPKKNYVQKFLKQRDIGNFMSFCNHGPSIMSHSFLNLINELIFNLIYRENPAKYPSLTKNPPKYTTAYIV